MSGDISTLRHLLSTRSRSSSRSLEARRGLGWLPLILGLVLTPGFPPAFLVGTLLGIVLLIWSVEFPRQRLVHVGSEGLSHEDVGPNRSGPQAARVLWRPEDVDGLKVTFLSGTVLELDFRIRGGATHTWVIQVQDTLAFLADVEAFANAAKLGERWRPRAWPLFILSLIGFPIFPALMGLVFAPLITAVPELWGELSVTVLLFSFLCRAATAPAMRTARRIRAFNRAPSGDEASRASVDTTGRDDVSRE